MLRISCFYFLFIVFVIISWTCLCESRRLGPMEKKLHVNRDHLIAKVGSKRPKNNIIDDPLAGKSLNF
ncbi:unnamed protein product [Eruca vesicaria subsp. sativa]|uniref:Uncharacterized protein n=1 Tax=Eruca vesicaria subsp. sativa TaxID=29727 RepID=A0ABC8JUH2_ERUVS|nr:unnamed protein product [Eruca vesicaria subsp. sativa]